MKRLIIIGLLLLFLATGAWGFTGLFFSGQQFDVLPDGTILVYDGVTKDGTMLITRKENMMGSPLDYYPIPISIRSVKGTTVLDSFTYTIRNYTYTFEPQASGGVRITRNE